VYGNSLTALASNWRVQHWTAEALGGDVGLDVAGTSDAMRTLDGGDMMPKQIALPLDAEDQVPNGAAEGTSSAPDARPGSEPVGQTALPPATDPLPQRGPARDSQDFDLHLLALGRVRGIGVKTLRALIDHYGDLRSVWEETPSALHAVLHQAKVRDSAAVAAQILDERERWLTAARRELQRLRADGVRLMGMHEPDFPRRLATVPDSPYWLFVAGDVAALHAPLIGIVGTRTPSTVGVLAAERLAAIVCREGMGIVSGLAEGIDASGHRVGLYYRAPQVAVLGTGIDVVFPTSTEHIRRWIVETGGAVVTEYLPGDSFNRGNFVERDRIQAALALAIAPVEGRQQSGTAHTVRFAEQYQRPLFAVQRGTPAPENELLALLSERGYPVFDLADGSEVNRLVAWLKGVVPPEVWPQQRRRPDATWFFRDILRQIDEVLTDIPVSPQEAQWLQEQIAQRIPVSTPADEDPRNGR
jgi:DNA protecting protein DprA